MQFVIVAYPDDMDVSALTISDPVNVVKDTAGKGLVIAKGILPNPAPALVPHTHQVSGVTGTPT